MLLVIFIIGIFVVFFIVGRLSNFFIFWLFINIFIFDSVCWILFCVGIFGKFIFNCFKNCLVILIVFVFKFFLLYDCILIW